MTSGVPTHLAAETRADACDRLAGWAIVLAVALVHILRFGAHLHGDWRRLYAGYASDLLLPLAMYFVLTMSKANRGRLRDWKARAAAVFAAASTAEILQGLGVPVLGRTFDPIDFLMYAGGVSIAALTHRLVLPAVCGKPRASRPLVLLLGAATILSAFTRADPRRLDSYIDIGTHRPQVHREGTGASESLSSATGRGTLYGTIVYRGTTESSMSSGRFVDWGTIRHRRDRAGAAPEAPAGRERCTASCSMTIARTPSRGGPPTVKRT